MSYMCCQFCALSLPVVFILFICLVGILLISLSEDTHSLEKGLANQPMCDIQPPTCFVCDSALGNC